jgi:hypothetical protein
MVIYAFSLSTVRSLCAAIKPLLTTVDCFTEALWIAMIQGAFRVYSCDI